MDESKLYRLRKPIKILNTEKFPATSWHTLDIESTTTHKDHPVLTTRLLDEQFVEIDIEQTRKQIEQIMDDFGHNLQPQRYSNIGEYKAVAVAAVLETIGMENTNE